MGDICQNHVYAKLMQTIIHLRRETSIKILSVPGAMEQSVKLRSGLLESMKTRDLKQVRESVNHFFHKSREFYDSILEKK